MAKKLMGIVALENDNVIVEGLMDYRPAPAISFLGRYRLIDFVVSNMTNSGISDIKVFVKKQPRSLIEHLGTGSQYNINSKRGKLQILYDEQTNLSTIYNNDINGYIQNMEFIENNKAEYVVVTPGYAVYSLDYNLVLEEHIKTKADITIVYKSVDYANENFIGCPCLTIENQQIKRIEQNLGQTKRRNISMETYVMSKEVFIKMVNDAHTTSALFTLRDMIRAKLMHDEIVAKGYQYHGYFACINSLDAYYKASMELIDHNKSKNLFKDDWPIFTKTNDSIPASYGKDAKVKHCLIANGCKIEGELENCVLGRGVIVEKGCVIKNSILLPESYFAKDCHVEYTVADKWANVSKIKEIHGNKDNIMYIRRRDKI